MSSAETSTLIGELDRLAAEFAGEIGALATEEEIRVAQARYLGKKGKVSELMKALGKLPPGERPAVGEAANRAKSGIERAVSERLAALAEASLSADLARVVDVTLPARGGALGTLHPLTLVRREIEEIFLGLGFEVRTGPWVESEWHNFDALNTPPDHPARDMQDTFFVEGGRILRSHTSPVQIRTMMAGPPPIRIVAPGNVFRRDDDATQTPRFPQMEGLYVDKDVSFADLKGTLLHFVHRFFGPNLGVRLRPSYFPFTEPNRRPRSTPPATCAPATARSTGGAAGCARGRAGSRSAGRAWCTPTCSARSATTRRRSPGSRSAWGCRGWRC